MAGREAKANYLVRPGDAIAVEVPAPAPATPQAEATPPDALFEDADIIVVNKPAGMVVHPAPGHGGGTLVNALLHHVDDLSGVGGELRPGIVHRLDRGTSGLLVVAKDDATHRALVRLFAVTDREHLELYPYARDLATQAAEEMPEEAASDPELNQELLACFTRPGTRGRFLAYKRNPTRNRQSIV